MNTRGRLAKLEQRAGATGGCRECGFTQYALITFVTNPDPTKALPPDARCQTCGQRLVFTIELVAPAGVDVTLG
jgi:hypothetical protein